MNRNLTNRPLFAMAMGGITGGLLLMSAVFIYSEDRPRNEGVWDLLMEGMDAFRRAQFLKSLFTAGLIGCIGGTIIAGATWIGLTRRRVPSMLLIASWWLLGACMGLLAATAVLMLPWMAPHMSVGRDGSGGPGVGLLILIVGLSGLAIGSAVGIAIGIAKAWSRSQ